MLGIRTLTPTYNNACPYQLNYTQCVNVLLTLNCEDNFNMIFYELQVRHSLFVNFVGVIISRLVKV